MAEIFYTPVKVVCADGITRTARARAYCAMGRICLHADTAFSVPAFVYAYNKTVRGYICPADGLAFMQDHEPTMEFRAYLYRKNGAVIPVKAAA